MRCLFIIILLIFSAKAEADILYQDFQSTTTEILEIKDATVTEITDKIAPDKFDLSGTVYIGENLLPKGKIYAIELENGTYGKVKTHTIKDGEFNFKNLEAGLYTYYIFPTHDYDFNYFPKYIPTYSGGSYNWEESNQIDLQSSDIHTNNSLVFYPNSFYGPKTISGTITFDNHSIIYNNIPIVVILLNEQKEPMDFRIIDKSTAEYSFENLPDGKYYIHPEIVGVHSEDYYIDFSKSDNSEKKANFYASDEISIIPSDDENISPIIERNKLSVFINSDLNEPVICELISITGKTVVKELFNSNEISINTSSLGSGIYILKINTFDNTFIKTKKVYINNN